MAISFSHKTINTLYETLVTFCWYKSQLRQFFINSEVPYEIINCINWDDKNNTKRKIAQEIFQKIQDHPKELINIGCFRRMANQLLMLTDDDIEKNFLAVDDSRLKIKEAKISLLNFKNLIEEQQKKKQKQVDTINDDLHKRRTFENELRDLKNKYIELNDIYDHQKRGYDFEELLNKLFILFEIHSKKSFKIKGEQIDGSFSLDGTEFLLEAKWHILPVNNSDIYPFMSKVQGKLDNTLGFMLSVNGFTEDAIHALNVGKRSVLLLADGIDLMGVLDDQITLIELIRAKKRHASRTGNSYCSIKEIFKGDF